MKTKNSLYTLFAISLFPVSALSQIAPDAGQTARELEPKPTLPAKNIKIEMDTSAQKESSAGGVQVNVKSIVFSGNTLYSETNLLAVLGEVVNKNYDLADMRLLTNKITEYYRAHGYAFARAYLPVQNMADGKLVIAIIEGHFGEVRVSGDDKLSNSAQRFLSDLKTGDVIESKPLERAVLILDDQPGSKIVPFMRPGQQVGTGDLNVDIKHDKRSGGSVSIDNHGNRYTGRNRVKLDLYLNSTALFGDQFTLSTLYTSEDMWMGALAYGLPVNGSGLRASLGYSNTDYQLAKEFESLDASGFVQTVSAGLSYPFIRSQRANITGLATYQHKNLEDEYGATNSTQDKSSDVMPLIVQFDVRDHFFKGGITYGAVSWTYGSLDLDDNLLAVDELTAKSDGSFQKINLDVARLQSVCDSVSVYTHVSAQWSPDNLDSSEGFGLGGADQVRAYPSGEAFGDSGWLAQVELRYAFHSFTPYLFYDAGDVKINADPWLSTDNYRAISATGLGLRYDQKKWYVNGVAAWRVTGGVPESDSTDTNPMFWVNAGYKF
ncbi:MAG: ShlB/FhaC/HecB family hemolysin secretion/activation protein [Gammaproteobacteria bacterium]|nr:ShlB/FhaC/HecB family hemolysin secretion/activation protein [Gammaproteobacteria bacterium]